VQKYNKVPVINNLKRRETMKGKQLQWLGIVLAVGLIGSFTFGIAACGSKTTTPYFLTITVSPSSPASLAVGMTSSFTATGTNPDGSTEDITPEVTWASDNTSVATVDSIGFAHGVSAGTTNITASLSGITSPPVLLDVKMLTSIVITPALPSILAIGSSQQFVATGIYSDGSTTDISSHVFWTSYDNTIATISPNGLANGIMAGDSYITAALSGVTNRVLLAVGPP
jgi:Bacterial Ig-like domain (group 2)